MALVESANDMEHIGDRIATSMVTSAQKRLDEDVNVSPETARILSEFHLVVVNALDDAIGSLIKQDSGLAKEVRKRKKAVNALTRNIAEHEFGRLTADAPNRLNTYTREMEVVEILKGVFTISRRIASKQFSKQSEKE